MQGSFLGEQKNINTHEVVNSYCNVCTIEHAHRSLGTVQPENNTTWVALHQGKSVYILQYQYDTCESTHTAPESSQSYTLYTPLADLLWCTVKLLRVMTIIDKKKKIRLISVVNYITVISESSEDGELNLLSGNAGSAASLGLPVTACSEFPRSTDYINAGNCMVSNKGCNCIQQIHQIFTKIIGPATNQSLEIERSNSRADLQMTSLPGVFTSSWRKSWHGVISQ